MKNKYLIIILILILISFIYYINKSKNTVCFKETCFEVEIADNQALMQKGLMYRDYLDKNKGMLFIFEESGIYPFWMKNTLIPLDIIWIDKAEQVVYIEKRAQPCKSDICQSYNTNKDAKYVLEINAGLSSELGINLGDKLYLKY